MPATDKVIFVNRINCHGDRRRFDLVAPVLKQLIGLTKCIVLDFVALIAFAQLPWSGIDADLTPLTKCRLNRHFVIKAQHSVGLNSSPPDQPHAEVLNDTLHQSPHHLTSTQPSRSHGRSQLGIMPLEHGNRSTHLAAQGVDVNLT